MILTVEAVLRHTLQQTESGLSTGLGRFIQPDTIVPSLGNPQMLNRYSYVGNNPINYIDPTGHVRVENSGGGGNTVSPKKNATTTNYVVEKKIAKGEARVISPSPQIDPVCLPIPIIISPGSDEINWMIIQYGKTPKSNSYTEINTYDSTNSNVQIPIVLANIPGVIGVSAGTSIRVENGVRSITHNATGNAGIGIPKGSIGGIVGTNNGLYVDVAGYGVQLAYPDTCAYSPAGSVGISTEVYETQWFLTTDEVIANSGGYEGFGDLYFPSYTSYDIWYSDTNKTNVLLRWNNNMRTMYRLQEKQ